MFNVCPNCGSYQVDKNIKTENSQSFAICSTCQHPHPFKRFPLFCLTGASGAGKSTLAHALTGQLDDFVVLEKDILWSDAFNTPESDFNEIWLRMAKNIHQSGKPVLLCGTTLPQHLDNSLEKRYFSSINFLALVCEDEVLADRLRARPTWRGFNDETIAEHVSFNQWIKNNYQTRSMPMEILDTSNKGIEECVEEVKSWLVTHQMQLN